jgi:hypothetical protein
MPFPTGASLKAPKLTLVIWNFPNGQCDVGASDKPGGMTTHFQETETNSVKLNYSKLLWIGAGALTTGRQHDAVADKSISLEEKEKRPDSTCSQRFKFSLPSCHERLEQA